MTLLDVRGLETHFISRDNRNRIRIARALNGVDFKVARGEILGLVGETGAGKSLTAYSVLGLLKEPARVVGGTAMFEGVDLLSLSPAELNRLRGRRLALVVQSPRSSLDPLSRVGDQILRVLRAHHNLPAAEARARVLKMLDAVGIPDPERRYRAWPHELSGGMAQRVLIAMALVSDPDLLIADEPTTGLDVTVQAQVLDLLRSIVLSRGLAAVIITHDFGVVANYCDRVAVMFAGRVVESGTVRAVFTAPTHPYTRALFEAMPERLQLGTQPRVGAPPPDLYDLPEGCHYRLRCPLAGPDCARDPPQRALGPEHVVACHRVAEQAA